MSRRPAAEPVHRAAALLAAEADLWTVGTAFAPGALVLLLLVLAKS